ncbi:hypothetical protein B0H17DRAFT_1184038 [Mycena rosella]|uniref:Uncharacterized protein n=1 Tax=Mycena rosella TaxID=1033263 RepID=A0AAD7CXS0_MYCRO|nr:hypothetical protein B0H17DRAFT_1184038 [Mycena rosella]
MARLGYRLPLPSGGGRPLRRSNSRGPDSCSYAAKWSIAVARFTPPGDNLSWSCGDNLRHGHRDRSTSVAAQYVQLRHKLPFRNHHVYLACVDLAATRLALATRWLIPLDTGILSPADVVRRIWRPCSTWSEILNARAGIEYGYSHTMLTLLSISRPVTREHPAVLGVHAGDPVARRLKAEAAPGVSLNVVQSGASVLYSASAIGLCASVHQGNQSSEPARASEWPRWKVGGSIPLEAYFALGPCRAPVKQLKDIDAGHYRAKTFRVDAEDRRIVDGRFSTLRMLAHLSIQSVFTEPVVTAIQRVNREVEAVKARQSSLDSDINSGPILSPESGQNRNQV